MTGGIGPESGIRAVEGGGHGLRAMGQGSEELLARMIRTGDGSASAMKQFLKEARGY